MARPSRATSCGLEPNERTPITGLSGLLFTSTTGAKLKLIPRMRSSRAVTAALKRASSSLPVAPRAIFPGKRVTPSVRRATAPPSWSTAIKRGTMPLSRAALWICPVKPATWAGLSILPAALKRMTPPRGSSCSSSAKAEPKSGPLK